MENDNEFSLAIRLMRSDAVFYVNRRGDYLLLDYFTDKQEKFEALCKSKGSRVEWTSPYGWGSICCRVVPEKQGAPYGEFCAQRGYVQ